MREEDVKTRETVRQLNAQLEVYLNQQSADLEVFRITLLVMFYTMLGKHPNKSEMLLGLKSEVMAVLSRSNVGGGNVLGEEKRKQFTLMRAEEFFQEAQRVIGVYEASEEKARS
jgi:hypothetical protein